MIKPLILLCNPPAPAGATVDRDAAAGMGALLPPDQPPQPPHTLAWSAAALRKAGWRVRGLDAAALGLDGAAASAAIVEQEAALLVLFVSPVTAEGDLKFVRALRTAIPGLPLLLIGLATRYLPPALAREADLVLLGEPEGALPAACAHLLEQKGKVGSLLPDALGVAGYGPRGNLLNLNDLPPPAWDLFPVRRYTWLPIVASRGCSEGCRYCPVPVAQGVVQRSRIVERVVAEMQLLHNRYGVRHFRFLDPLFAADRAYTQNLLELIVQRELNRHVRWSCETRPEKLDLQLLRQMSRAGCEAVHIGLEAVSPETLVAVGRLPDARSVQGYLERVRQIILGCRAFGLSCHLHVMAGLPGDRANAYPTRTFLRAYAPYTIHIHRLEPYPGTSIFPTIDIDNEKRLLDAIAVPPAGRMRTASSRWWQALHRTNRLPSI